jgi:Domain of unknown function (DUF4180)
MSDTSYDLHGVRVFECGAEGPQLRSDCDAIDLVSAMSGHNAAMIVIPIERLHPDFFQLSTRVAGEIIQKFVNYRLRVAILGDISRYVAESTAFRDFVREGNREITSGSWLMWKNSRSGWSERKPAKLEA